MGKGKINREELVQTLVKWRLEKKLSTHTLVKLCMEQFGYEQSYAYNLVKEARQYIANVYREWAIGALEESIAELEEQLESAKRGSDKKLQLEIVKELNKVKSLYIERSELTVNDYSAKFPTSGTQSGGTQSIELK